jgi:homoserine dehydrogenase
MKVAVMGYGVVGQGVVTLLDRYDKTLVKYILSLSAVDDARFISDTRSFMEDASVGIVVEATGDVEMAFVVLSEAMKKGKHAVTSSKGLVAKYGAKLLRVALDHGVNFMFEASVGGGIPLLSTLRHGLAHEPIYEVLGILNGTSNYILTQMRLKGLSFKEALEDAQSMGYAERDPSDDIKGYDTARKIAILGSILSGKTLDFETINIRGIDEISEAMLSEVTGRVRLVAHLKIGDEISVAVEPTLITQAHPFYGVEGVDNAVIFRGKDVGDIMIMGPGAGRYPTASAVVSDVLYCLAGMRSLVYWSEEVMELVETDPLVKVLHEDTLVPLSEVKGREYLRVCD